MSGTMRAQTVLRVGLGCALALSAACANAQDKSADDLFAGADKFSKGASSSSEVNLDKSMLGGLGGAGKMDYVYVRSYEYPNPGMYSMADVEEMRSKLDASGCKHMVRTREKDELTDICVKTDDEGKWREMVVISAEPKELSLIHLKGQLSLHDLDRLGSLGGQPAPDPKLQHR